jgi:hypothetical protein
MPTPSGSITAPTPPWLLEGLSRGALSGLLASLLLGGLEAWLVAARADLGAAQVAVLGVYATGVLSLLLVPWGMVVGAALCAYRLPLGAASGWLNGLAMDEARDLQATRWLLVGASWVGVSAGLLVWAADAGWLAALTPLDGLWALPVGLLVSAALAAPLARALTPLVARLPLESLGRPHMTKLQGLLYILGLLALGALAPALLSLADRVEDPVLIVASAWALLGPGLMHGLLRRADAARTGHPFVMLLSWLALAVMSMRPTSSFDQQPQIRDASYAHTALTQHALRWLGARLGDRDGDGVPGLFGGPDCDDLDPRKALRCDDSIDQ